MKILRRFLTVASLAGLAGGMASAATIGPTTTYYPGTQPNSSTVLPFNSTTCAPAGLGSCVGSFPNTAGNDAYISVQGFDPSLGVLNSVSIVFQGATYGDISIQNDTGAAMSVQGSYLLGMYILDPQSTIPVSGPYDANTNFAQIIADVLPSLASLGRTVITSDGSTSPSDTSNSFTSSFLGSSAISTDNNDASLASLFSQAGTLYLPLFTQASSSLNVTSNNQNYIVSTSSQQIAAVTLTYNYTPAVTTTPEPTTMVLLGSALLGIGLLRKRVRS